MLVFYFIFLPFVHCFLLNNQQSNGSQTLPANQYMTLSKFYEEEKRLQQKMEYLQQDTTTLRQNLQQDSTALRHDMDNSLALLTTQLQQKFDLLDKKVADIDPTNKTNQDLLILEQKYEALQQNNNNLKNENSNLQKKYSLVDNELQLVTNKTKRLDEFLLVQTGLYNDALKKLSIQGKELGELRKKSNLVDQEILNLKQLGSIQPLQEINTLQQKVQTISAQTNSLSIKELARSQDFLALYNMTTSSLNELDARTNSQMKELENNYKTSVSTIQHKVDNRINETIVNQNKSMMHLERNLNIQLQHIQNNQSETVNEFAAKLREYEKRDNLTHSQLQKQIDDSTEIVALTGQLTHRPKGIMKFDNVIFSVGYNNLTAYKSTGKFVCEKSGIYLISATILSEANNANYNMYLNNNKITSTYISYNGNHPSSMANTGTIVLALQLHPADSVWLTNTGDTSITFGVWSTFSIVKVK